MEAAGVRREPAIGPAQRVRPLDGPMAGADRTRWAGAMINLSEIRVRPSRISLRSIRAMGLATSFNLLLTRRQEIGNMEEFHRIRRLPPYVFEQVNRAKAAARNHGADIVDLGMGNPDLATPAHVIEKLKETVGRPRTDRYSASKGIPGLRRAQAAYYARRFGVKLNPDTQVVATFGSKEAFANVAQAITAPGNVVLV